jgi:hypothetical protein
MQITYENGQAMRSLTAQEVDQISGGALFGEWVGKLSVWANPGGLVADIATGGALSSAAGRAMSQVEDWVNGK